MTFRLLLMIALAMISTACAAGLEATPVSTTELPTARMLPGADDAPIRYVALGDSTVEGIGATSPETTYVGQIFTRLQALYPAAELDNLGVAGATASDVVVGQLDEAIRLQPQLVTLSIGPNDITQGRSVQEYEADLAVIFGRLASETRAAVVANLLPDLGVAPVFTPEQKTLVNQITREVNAAMER